MPAIHPTTLAIIAGLLGEAPSGSALEHGITLEVHRLVVETGLKDADEIARAGLDGWNLSVRQEGTRHEITARFRDDRGYEILVTAMIDRHKTNMWRYSWIAHAEIPTKTLLKEAYPNGIEKSFADAMAVARAKQA